MTKRFVVAAPLIACALMTACGGDDAPATQPASAAPEATDPNDAGDLAPDFTVTVERAQSFTEIVTDKETAVISDPGKASPGFQLVQLTIALENVSSAAPIQVTYDSFHVTTTDPGQRVGASSIVTGILTDGCAPGITLARGERAHCSVAFEIAGRATALSLRAIDGARFGEVTVPVPPVPHCHALAQAAQSAPVTSEPFELPASLVAPPQGTFVLTAATIPGVSATPARTIRISGTTIETTTTQYDDDRQTVATYVPDPSGGPGTLQYSCTTPVTPHLTKLTEKVGFTYDEATGTLVEYTSSSRFTYARR